MNPIHTTIRDALLEELKTDRHRIKPVGRHNIALKPRLAESQDDIFIALTDNHIEVSSYGVCKTYHYEDPNLIHHIQTDIDHRNQQQDQS